MRRIAGLNLLLAGIVPFIAIATGVAVPLDQKLLSLVPPGVELVTGIASLKSPVPRGIVFLSTRYTRLDYNDFFALTGVDSSRRISQVLLTDSPSRLDRHGLLAIGNFDQARIYKSATDGGAHLIDYRGFPVVRIEPFAREKAVSDQDRWLAILGTKILLFGAFDMVHQAIDRYLNGSTPDPALAHRIARLRHADATWSVLSSPDQCAVIRASLAALDPRLASLPAEGGVQFGVRYGKVMQIEYEITPPAELAYSAPRALTPSIAGMKMTPSAPPEGGLGVTEHRVRGVIKVPANRYAAWFDEIYAKWRARNAPAPPNAPAQ